MAFIEQVKNEMQQDTKTWVSKWLVRKNLKQRILTSAKKGYTAFKFDITPTVKDDVVMKKDKSYLNRLETLEYIEKSLGPGFEVYHQQDYKTFLFFETPIKEEKIELVISWKEGVK